MTNDLTWIRVEALNHGLKIKDIADRVGMSRQTFYSILNGFQGTPMDFERKVREALGNKNQDTVDCQGISEE